MKKFLSLLLVITVLLSFTACSSACEDIELSKDTITFTKQGQSKGINVTTDPKDTSDEVTFESDDEDVATVDKDGLVRAEGPGETTIIVRCGDEVAYCEVICDFEGGSSRNDEPEEPDEPDDPDAPDNGCDTCGDTGVCPECHGNYRCEKCSDTNGNCSRCDGKGEIVCRTCEGEPDECRVCGGDGIYTESDKTGEKPSNVPTGGGYAGIEWGTECKECMDGKDCAKCNGTAIEDCPDCNYGYCPECNGTKIICDECDKGQCPDCT